jgi:hypothetical protein
MKKLIPILRLIEIELRTYGSIKSEKIWDDLSNLTDWEYRIVQDFMLRVNIFINNNNLNFVYKLYEKSCETDFASIGKKCDLLICSLRRDVNDTCMTDVVNRLVIPTELKYEFLDMWGSNVTQARNMAVVKSLEFGCKYLLFIDDDIVAPNNALLKMYGLMIKENRLVVGANYYRKVKPLITAYGNVFKYKEYEDVYETDLCAMGLTLINIDEVSKKVPFPLFWEFGAPDGYWSMGEDAFFTKNLIEYTNEMPLVDFSIKTLHYDKNWKCCYGERDDQVTYATNCIEDIDRFERLRVPQKFPNILIGIPTRNEHDPIATSLEKLILLRGYRSNLFRVHGLNVDEARNVIVREALKNDYNYLLFIDDDIIPPIDGLCRLIEHLEKDKDLGAVTGDYLLKGEPFHSVHLQLNKDGLVCELNRTNNDDKLVYSNWLIGLGFCLIDLNVFRQMREPWFKCHFKDKSGNKNVNEDAHFSEMIFENGYKILIDKDIKCAHVDYSNKKVYLSKDCDINKLSNFDWLNDMNIIESNNL